MSISPCAHPTVKQETGIGNGMRPAESSRAALSRSTAPAIAVRWSR